MHRGPSWRYILTFVIKRLYLKGEEHSTHLKAANTIMPTPGTNFCKQMVELRNNAYCKIKHSVWIKEVPLLGTSTRRTFFQCSIGFFKWANPGLFLFIFVLFTFQLKLQIYNLNFINWKKRRWCAWKSNLGQQDGRRRQIHWAMAAPIVTIL